MRAGDRQAPGGGAVLGGEPGCRPQDRARDRQGRGEEQGQPLGRLVPVRQHRPRSRSESARRPAENDEVGQEQDQRGPGRSAQGGRDYQDDGARAPNGQAARPGGEQGAEGAGPGGGRGRIGVGGRVGGCAGGDVDCAGGRAGGGGGDVGRAGSGGAGGPDHPRPPRLRPDPGAAAHRRPRDHDGDDVEGQSRAGLHGRDRVPRGVNGFVQGPPDEGAYGVGARQDDRREDGGAGPAPGDRHCGTGSPPGGQFGAGDFEGAGSARRERVDERQRRGGLGGGDSASRCGVAAASARGGLEGGDSAHGGSWDVGEGRRRRRLAECRR